VSSTHIPATHRDDPYTRSLLEKTLCGFSTGGGFSEGAYRKGLLVGQMERESVTGFVLEALPQPA
jgi:hypothetical protein